jgi:hypothetical protein
VPRGLGIEAPLLNPPWILLLVSRPLQADSAAFAEEGARGNVRRLAGCADVCGERRARSSTWPSAVRRPVRPAYWYAVISYSTVCSPGPALSSSAICHECTHSFGEWRRISRWLNIQPYFAGYTSTVVRRHSSLSSQPGIECRHRLDDGPVLYKHRHHALRNLLAVHGGR